MHDCIFEWSYQHCIIHTCETCLEKACFLAYVKQRASDQCLPFCYIFIIIIVQSLCFLNLKFQASGHLFGCTARFVSDLVGNKEDTDRFCRVAAHCIFEWLYQHCISIIYFNQVREVAKFTCATKSTNC